MSRPAVAALVCALLCVLSPSVGPAKPLLNPSLFGLGRPAAPQPSLVFVYRGWRVDASGARGVQSASRTVRAIKSQIDQVESDHLTPGVMAFLRTTPISADATRGRGEPSSYRPGHGVSLRVRGLDPKRPALLFGLMLAYQDLRLPGGVANREVDGFLRQTVARHAWPKAALMLQDDRQFFALTATAYIDGAITREPYTRADLRNTAPQYYQWLANLFDGGKPRR